MTSIRGDGQHNGDVEWRRCRRVAKRRNARDTMLVLISVSFRANTREGGTEGSGRVGYGPEVRPGRQTDGRPPGVSSGLRLIQNPDYLCVPQAVQAARCLTRRNGR